MPFGGSRRVFPDLGALPLVVPVSFVSAVLVWRTLPSDVPYFGSIAGSLSTVAASLPAGTVLVTLDVAAVIRYGQYARTPEAAAFTALGGVVAPVPTCWLTPPVGNLGAVHERATR